MRDLVSVVRQEPGLHASLLKSEAALTSELHRAATEVGDEAARHP